MEGVRSLTVLQTHCHVAAKHVDFTSVLLLFVAAASRGMEGCVVTEHHHAGVSTRAAQTGREQVRARNADGGGSLAVPSLLFCVVKLLMHVPS